MHNKKQRIINIECMVLSDCKKGFEGEIVAINVQDKNIDIRLLNLGVEPHGKFTVLFEAFGHKTLLIAISGGKVAISDNICKKIEVKPACKK